MKNFLNNINFSGKNNSEQETRAITEYNVSYNQKLLQAQPISKNAPCYCGSGKKIKHCHENLHPRSKTAYLLLLYRDIDETIEEYRKEHGITVPCVAGCSNCCYDYFNISEVEFELILKHIEKSWTIDEITNLYVKAEENIATFKEENSGLYNALLEKTDTDKQLRDFMKYLRQKTSFPCPFLDQENGKCQIYGVRPLICRTHGSAHIKDQYKPGSPCEIIPNGKEHQNITPSVGHIFAQVDGVTNIKEAGSDKIHPQRGFPIFYWFSYYPGFKVRFKLIKFENFEISLDEYNRIRIEESL